MPTPKSVTAFLKNKNIIVSAPTRLEVGGTWDVKGFALAYEWIKPCTVNIALDLRTTIKITAHTSGTIKLINGAEVSEFSLLDTDFKNQQKLLYAIACHYGLDGYSVSISYQTPPKSGLGGSGTIAVAFITALEYLSQKVRGINPKLNKQKIVYLAHCIEESLDFSITGLQDQCAACYGGVNYWEWQYSSQKKFVHKKIANMDRIKELEQRIVVGYLAVPHNSTDMNSIYVNSFFDSKNRSKWLAFNEQTRILSSAIESGDWQKVIDCVNYENKFREDITQERLLPLGYAVWERLKKYNAGFSVCGAGGGGCVWAIAKTPDAKKQIIQEFKSVLGEQNILPVKVAASGVTILESSYE